MSIAMLYCIEMRSTGAVFKCQDELLYAQKIHMLMHEKVMHFKLRIEKLLLSRYSYLQKRKLL